MISFVIVKAFYPLLLTVTCKFGIHFNHIFRLRFEHSWDYYILHFFIFK
ncbi:hypothetical protein [Staphylococcus phage PT1-1]